MATVTNTTWSPTSATKHQHYQTLALQQPSTIAAATTQPQEEQQHNQSAKESVGATGCDATTPVIANLGGPRGEEDVDDNDKQQEHARSSQQQQQQPPPLELPKSVLDVDTIPAIEETTKEEASIARFSCSKSPAIVLEQWPSPNNNHSVLDDAFVPPPPTPVPRTISVNTHSQIRGIPNYGQTCFLNAVLQSLASLTAFDVYLNTHIRAARRMRPSLQLLRYEDDHDGGSGGSGAAADDSTLYLTKLLSRGLQFINGVGGEKVGSFDPRLLLEAVAQSHKQFQASHQQQDAQELLTALLDVLVQEQETRRITTKPRKRNRGLWLSTLPATPEPEATSFAAYTPPATVWALSPAFFRLQLSMFPTDEEETAATEDAEGGSPWNDVGYDLEDDTLSVASSAREHARQLRRERRVQSTTTSPVGNVVEVGAQNGSKETKTSHKSAHKTNNGTATTSLSSTSSTQSPALVVEGEEKKQEQDEFEVHVPRVDSDEDFIRSPLLAASSLPKKSLLLGHHLDRTKRLATTNAEAEEDSTAVSDLSSSVVTQQSSTTPSHRSQHGFRHPQRRAADRLAMPLCGWMGSTLQCRKCHYVRPIQNVPFVDLSIVPSSVGDPHAMNKTGGHCRPCTVEECLSDFTKVERVEQVDCPSCTKREQIFKAQEEVEFWEFTLADATAIQNKKKQQQQQVNNDKTPERSSSLSSNSTELQSIREELERHRDTLQRWQLVNCDDECCVEQMAHLLGIEDTTKEEARTSSSSPQVLLRQDANKCLFLTRLPPVFCLHIQRRYYDPQTARLSKTTQPVLFDEFLNVAPYCAYTASRGNTSNTAHYRPRTGGAAPSWVAGKSSHSHHHKPRTAMGTSQSQQRPIFYRLMAVLEHRGGANCGHYVCYRRAAGGEWLYVSDHVVRKVAWKTVQQCQAYMLFYENCSISE